MGHYYDCRHCGFEDHNHTCPGKEAETKRMQEKYANMSAKMTVKSKEPTRRRRRALDVGD